MGSLDEKTGLFWSIFPFFLQFALFPTAFFLHPIRFAFPFAYISGNCMGLLRVVCAVSQ